ncbi:uncharacterized protein LOC135372484 [Ornithodoros turicata]|uniref:uncharacterized protein LOC135372484 n=1 Tax=Ornithodoros turicata TaxID=34597 RepID=UPI003139D911
MDIAEEGSPKYWIVKFPEERNSIAIVHATWMQNGKCAWPNEKDPRRLQQITMKGLKPQSSWLTYDCTRVFAFDTYDAARRKLAQAEDTSDLCSENELGRGKRKKKRKVQSEEEVEDNQLPAFYPDELSNSSGDEVCTPTPRSLPTPPQRPPTPPRSAFFATSSKGPAHGSGNFSGHTATPGSTYGNDGAFPSQSTSLQMHGMYPQMGPSATKVTTNHQYVPRQGRLYQDLQERRHRRCEVAQQQPASRNVHPSSAACSFSHQKELHLLYTFLRFEEELKESSEKRNRLKLFMKFVGGATVGERTFRILSRLLSPAVGKEFSLHGTKGKLKFSDLQTWRVLCYSLAPEDQAKVSSKGTLKEIEKATQSWLRHAPESHRRQQARQAAENADSL